MTWIHSKLLATIMALLCPIGLYSQATFTTGPTALQMVSAIAGGSPNLTFSNPVITTGVGTQMGLFSNGIAGAGLMVDSTIILSSSSATEVFTSNNQADVSLTTGITYADPDLQAINPSAIYDVVILEFDLQVSGSAKGFRIAYQFGSDEYPEYVCSQFNDVFGFFVSGGSIVGSQNIATVPGSGNPVAVNSVNVGTAGIFQDGTPCDLGQGSLFTDNGNGAAGPVFVEFNGITTALNAIQVLDTGITYHLKLAIADVGDASYDSGVFVEYVKVIEDQDGDGIFNFVDLDDDNDGIPDLVEGNGDTDGDGIIDAFDLDSDGDGCPDAVEAGHGIYVSSGNTVPGPYGANGLANAVETGSESGILNYSIPAGGGGNYFQDSLDRSGCTPNAIFDVASTNEDTAVLVDVQNNDTDPDGGPLTTNVVGGPSNGIAIVVNGDSISYTPDPNFNGVDTLIYSICDNGTPALCDTDTVIITVNPVNDGPVANSDPASTNEDTSVLVDVQNNDTDLDGDPLTTTVVGGPSNGTAIVVNGDSISYTPDPNFNGTDTLIYSICDNGTPVLCDTDTVIITVNPVNDAPVANIDPASTDEDMPVSVDVQGNDNDLDGDPLTTTVVTGPSNGTAVVVNGDSITYTPDPNFNGVDTLIYSICDNGTPVLCDTDTVIIMVNPVNDAPVATLDPASTNEDTSVLVDVQNNDTDLDGDPLTTTVVSGPSNGTAIVVNGDSISYTPDPNFNGTDTLIYSICDNGTPVLCDTDTVIITVNPVNDAPVANIDPASTDEDMPVSVDVQGNDNDLDGDPLTTTVVTGPSNGTAVVVNGDSITYTPDPNFNGVDTLIYSICDNGTPVLCDTDTVIIMVNPVNDAPVATLDPASTNEDTSVLVDVQNNDTDLDGDPLTTTVVSGPSNGTAIVVNGDSISYTPDPNFNGTDTLIYSICDNGTPVLCDTDTVIITVNPVNDAPVANIDPASTDEDTPVSVDVQGNDNDLDGDPLTTTVVVGPSNGTAIVVNGDSITYTPDPNFNGVDTLIYSICDNGTPVLCDTDTVIIMVNPVNDAPVATLDPASTNEDTSVMVDVQSNDTDSEGDPLTTTVVGGPSNGTAIVVNGDSISYTPDPNFNGVDTLIYSICDNGTPVLCDTDTVIITVNPVNDAPVANIDPASTDEDMPVSVDVQGNDNDLDGDPLTTTVVTGPSNGTAVVVNGDSITYTPDPNFNGMDTLIYSICDNGTPVLCDTDTVIIMVNPVNDAPVATLDPASTNEDTSVMVDVQSNDTDSEGDPLTTTVVGGPSNGTAIVVNGDSISYTPDPNFNGVDTLIYSICDNGIPVLCDTDTVIITVNPVNDPPVANTDPASTNEDTPVSVDVQANDSDAEGDPLTTTVVAGPSNGSAVVVNGDSITYTPDPNFNGMDTLIYSICDNGTPVMCDTDTVIITVNPVNDPPIANIDSVATNEEVPFSINVQGNDINVDGDTLTTTIVLGPSNGTAVVINGNNIGYTPDPGFNGFDTLIYSICDNGTPVLCDTDTVLITVVAVDDPPVANTDSVATDEDTPVMVDVQANDVDPDGDALITTILSGPSNGTAVVVNGDSIFYTPDPNFNGMDTLLYVICDGGRPNLCDTDTVIVTINLVNDPPIATLDLVTTNEDIPVSVDVQGNDNDLDGDSLTTTIVVGPSNGTAVVVNGDSITYTPDPNFNGIDTLIYSICDNGIPVLCDTDTVILTVNPVNDAPIAILDPVSTNEDIPVSVDVQGNDIDVDGDPLTTTIVTGPSNGTAVVVNGDSITYTPDPNFNGMDTLIYSICDNGTPVLCDTDTVILTVNPVNDAPVAIIDSVTTDEDIPVSVDVQGNDSDLDGDSLTTTIVVGPSNGTAVVVNGDSITYTPDPNFNGIDTLIYSICDNGIPVLCDTDTVILTVNPVNDAPIAILDPVSTNEDIPVSVDVQGNDIDVDGDSLTTTIVTGPSNGTAVVVNGDSITYTPDPNFNGMDTLIYSICDNGTPVLCDTDTVILTVNPVNDAPVAIIDSVTTDEDIPVSVDVQGNDSDLDGDSLATTIVVGPSNGTAVVVNGDSITYTPDPNFNGIDTLIYSICDNGTPVLCDTDTVILTVNPVNDAPIAILDPVSTNEDIPVSVDVQGNDIDVDGDSLTTTIVIGPSNGTAVVVNGDSITYTPDPNFNGMDTLIYSICDNGTPVLCDTDTVILTVNPVNDAPVAIIDSVTTNEDIPVSVDVQGNDNDLDGDSLTTTIVVGPSNGTAVVVNGDSITYTPDPNFNGIDTLIYSICDNGIPVLCDTDTVILTVSPVNDAPIAILDPVSTNEDIPVSVDVQGNDIDVDGDSLTTTIVTGPSNGTAVVVNGDSITYTPDPNFNGMDTLIYSICDNGTPVLCDTDTVIITVNSVNDVPVAMDDSTSVLEDNSVVIDILGNDHDGDPGDLMGGLDTNSVAIITPPSAGTVVPGPNGTYIYSPDSNFCGLDSFQYVVCDNGIPAPALCDSAWVFIEVECVNDPPVALDDNGQGFAGLPVTVTVLSNDSDLDGDVVSVTGITTQPQNGTVNINPDGSITYIPNPGFLGLDTFCYVICDNGIPSLCDTACVVIEVLDNNDPPVASDDTVTTLDGILITIDVLTNDSDPEGDSLVITQVGCGPSNGIAFVIMPDSIAYLPNLGFVGVDSFCYIVCDPMGQCDTGYVYVTVLSTNTPPVAVDDSVSTSETSIDIPVLFNDSDVDNDVISVASIPCEPVNGSVTINGNILTYVPADGFIGQDSFCYVICDNGSPAMCDTGWVYVEVLPMDLTIPNSFTPNGDDVNDNFVIRGLMELYPENGLQVFNRWGNIVFEAFNYQNNWDGKYAKTGEQVPDGTYFYKLEFESPQGTILRSGYIVIFH